MISARSLPPPDDRQPLRRALLSVSDKNGLADFARRLAALGVELLSTGGTARTLREAGLAVTDVADVTGFPEMLDGRVKTLHPHVHGGILARRNDSEDVESLRQSGIVPIDLVVVNLYPFAEAVASGDVADALAVENIDIGGPAMLRAAAKNYFFVAAVCSPGDYDALADELENSGGMLSLATRRRLAQRAFSHTATYDAAIAEHLAGAGAGEELPRQFSIRLPKALEMRYGENPHQQAALYGEPARYFETLHGKELSFNNLLDLNAALLLMDEFRDADPACAILKHTNPCGVGTGASLIEAYRRAFETDRQSPFGGIVVVNRPLDDETAAAVDEIFTEIVIAPDFEEGVLDRLRQKKNRRVVRILRRPDESRDLRSVVGGVLVQLRDPALGSFDALRQSARVVTRRAPTDAEWRDLDFAWRVCKHVKSNAIVYARGGGTLGIGAGQMSRIDASELAVAKARKSGLDLAGAVLASDAFFPFADGLLAATEAGAVAVIQPGGSVRDEEVIEAADANGVAMIFTGTRHFRH
jgi:phosphoribosylaminoimidazolecarboxamide formyltransferase / IMP cyclohydrolase